MVDLYWEPHPTVQAFCIDFGEWFESLEFKHLGHQQQFAVYHSGFGTLSAKVNPYESLERYTHSLIITLNLRESENVDYDKALRDVMQYLNLFLGKDIIERQVHSDRIGVRFRA